MITEKAWHNATTLHPVGLAAVLILGVWMVLASRRHALVPLLILICFIPSAQRIVIAGLDLTLLRVMVMFGMARIVLRGEVLKLSLNRMDAVFVSWAVIGAAVYIVRIGETSAAVLASGQLMDMLGAYLLGRVFIQRFSDFKAFATAAALIALPVAGFFAVEYATQRNLFAVFGGVREYTWVRMGRLRCQGAFSHAILAGVFWASLAPIFLGGALGASKRWLFAAAAFCSVFVIFATASSTPLLGFLAGLGFWAWWSVRHYMRWAFIGTPFVLVALHIAMEAPVWHLVSRVSAVGGSTGFHRYALIDGAINHIHEWWLLGTNSSAHWHRWSPTYDVANQYIFEAVQGGIWRLGLFVTLIVLAALSIARAQGRAATKTDRLLLWGLGGSLFVHCVCFIGVSYFGQITYLWYLTLAIAGSALAPDFIDARARSRGDLRGAAHTRPRWETAWRRPQPIRLALSAPGSPSSSSRTTPRR